MQGDGLRYYIFMHVKFHTFFIHCSHNFSKNTCILFPHLCLLIQWSPQVYTAIERKFPCIYSLDLNCLPTSPSVSTSAPDPVVLLGSLQDVLPTSRKWLTRRWFLWTIAQLLYQRNFSPLLSTEMWASLSVFMSLWRPWLPCLPAIMDWCLRIVSPNKYPCITLHIIWHFVVIVKAEINTLSS